MAPPSKLAHDHIVFYCPGEFVRNVYLLICFYEQAKHTEENILKNIRDDFDR